LKVIKNFKGEIKPTNTGLLFFGKDPSTFIPQNEIRIARFKGVTRLETIDSQEIKGPIYKMLDDVESFSGETLEQQIKLWNLNVSIFQNTHTKL